MIPELKYLEIMRNVYIYNRSTVSKNLSSHKLTNTML